MASKNFSGYQNIHISPDNYNNYLSQFATHQNCLKGRALAIIKDFNTDLVLRWILVATLQYSDTRGVINNVLVEDKKTEVEQCTINSKTKSILKQTVG